MAGLRAPQLSMNSYCVEILTRIIGRSKSAQNHVLRARIILLAAADVGNQKIADQLNTTRLTVRKWRNRWSLNWEKLFRIQDEKELQQEILVHDKIYSSEFIIKNET